MTEIHAKAKRALKLMMGRQIAMQVITFVGGVVIARTLGPSEFGLYVISLFVVSTCAMIGDFGLAPSFIQRKKDLAEAEIQVGFTLQQIITTILVLVLLFAARPLQRAIYPDAPRTVWLIRALCFNLYLTSWRTMSALQLERHLKYDRLARIEVLEMLTYQVLAVTLALLGAGTWSYIVAVLAQGVLGTTLIYLAAPWRVRLRFDRKIAWELIRYAVPFQFQIVLNSLGGWVTPLIVGRQLGPGPVGYLTWASSNGRKPMLITETVTRVAFPHFSRIQDDPEEVERTITRYLSILLLIAGLWFVGIFGTTPAIVALIYKPKWVPAVPALILFAASLGLDMVSMLVCVTLNSIGRMAATTKMVAVRSALNIVMAILLVYLLGRERGYNGVAIAYLLSSCLTVPWLIRAFGPGALRRLCETLAWILVPVGAGMVAAEVALLAVRGMGPGNVDLAIRASAGGGAATLAYTVAAWMAAPEWMKTPVRNRLARFMPRPAPLAVAGD